MLSRLQQPPFIYKPLRFMALQQCMRLTIAVKIPSNCSAPCTWFLTHLLPVEELQQWMRHADGDLSAAVSLRLACCDRLACSMHACFTVFSG